MNVSSQRKLYGNFIPGSDRNSLITTKASTSVLDDHEASTEAPN